MALNKAMWRVSTRATRVAIALSLVVVLTGCGKSLVANGLGGPTVTRVEMAELPGPNGQTGLEQGYRYTLGPLDKLLVNIIFVEGLSDLHVTVDGSGFITLPIAGSVKVGGLTIAEASDLIALKLRQGHIRNPEVSINLEQAVSSFITVDGEVELPGNYPALPGLTLVRAVAGARGATEFSKLDEVIIRRTVQGRDLIALYDLRAIRSGNYADPQLYPGDIVTVGNSPGRRALQTLITLSPLLVSPLITAVRGY